MHETVLNSGWESLLLAIPFIGLLLAGMFHLEQLFTSLKHRSKFARRTERFEYRRHTMLSDPDGRPWDDAPLPLPLRAPFRN